MEWREVVEHPSLKDLPFKIETNAEGYIMMTPARGRQGIYQSRIDKTLGKLAKDGETCTECPVQTSEGTKVADVAWGSTEFFRRNKDNDNPYPESPEVVVEVKSPSNSEKAMKWKAALYFEKGAKEVWFCDDDGDMRFFNPQGKLERSEFFAEFPEHIEIDIIR
ncbi:MAG: Uma2 family endonuclease [Syntrophobacteraceae bacterium]|nr:Uma2 family endonuclease [Syntrophobacteraceae bacterium]